MERFLQSFLLLTEVVAYSMQRSFACFKCAVASVLVLNAQHLLF